MENNTHDRMAQQRKRGNPGADKILERGAPQDVREIGDAAPALPPIKPIICICCGRGMTPKVKRTEPTKRYIDCSLCGRSMILTYRPNMPTQVSKN